MQKIYEKNPGIKGVKNSIFRANIVKIGEFERRVKNVRKKIRENERGLFLRTLYLERI